MSNKLTYYLPYEREYDFNRQLIENEIDTTDSNWYSFNKKFESIHVTKNDDEK